MTELVPVQKPKKKKVIQVGEGKSDPLVFQADDLKGYQERFKNTVGVSSVKAGMFLMNHFYGAFPHKENLDYLNQVNELMGDLSPEDPFEGMLIQQMTTCHLLHLEATRNAYNTQYTNVRQSYMKQAMQLARTYAQLLETLTKKRNKGNQKITVQHVNVQDGGQAIVGNVQQGGKG